ncbi:MAG TPA: DNA polymerase III subunit alpha, partial [Trebonia sp.]
MSLIGFTHLHVASSYSLRYGMASPAALVARAAELGMPALALTDRDGLYGAFRHAQACTEAGLKPILGADLALRDAPWHQVAPGAALEWARQATRVTLLAEGRQGWASLCRLVTAAHAGTTDHGITPVPAGADIGTRAGADVSPAVTPGLIARHAVGLILLLGPASDVGQAVAGRRLDLARSALDCWRDLGVEVAIEVVDHLDAPGSTHRAARMAQLAQQANVPAVLTNAVRYLAPADSPVAQVLDAARHLVPLGSPKISSQAHNGHAFLASPDYMSAVAGRIAESFTSSARTLLRETEELALRCRLDPAADLGIGRHHLPEASTLYLGLYRSAQQELRGRCEDALAAGRYQSAVARQRGASRTSGASRARRAARERLDQELEIIARTGTASYFLTVTDIADRIKARGIRCAIRGSGAGSFVNHLLGISAIDPLEHGLLMERFLSPVRTTLPDIDLDVESARRLEAYQVIFDRYGAERAACVSMMETYRARSAIRDVAAAMSLPPDEIGRIAKAFPHIRARHITSALEDLPELTSSNLSTPQLATIFGIAERLDGLPRHVAMHPCGILLSDATLMDRTAVQRSSEGFSLSHLDKDDAEIAGVIKLDVLGVRMQSAMAYTIAEIARTSGPSGDVPREALDLDKIPRDDEPTYAMIKEARTLGCFQIESPGQRELVRKLAPETVSDLIVDISLFRPGPVSSDMISPFLKARHGLQPPAFPHPDLREALAETGGVVVYHEQVLRILDVLTGCGLAEADLVRRHLSKDEGPRRTKPWFRAAARRRGYDEATIDSVWQVIAAFGGFGFCKAHAAAFAIPVYQSAWLKRHHPAAFYAGVLTHDPGMYPKRVIVADARLAGISVLPLDVNASADGWRTESRPPAVAQTAVAQTAPAIRVSLREVKGISDAEVARIVAGQPYTSLRDFWERARPSRPVAERMVLVGAFDSIYSMGSPTRRDLLARVGVLDRAAARASGTVLDLFGGQAADDGMADLVPAGQLRDLDPAERVAAELDILGFDVSRHVLDFYGELLTGLGTVRSVDLEQCRSGETVLVAGVKVATQTPAVRSGQRVIFATLDDAAGLADLVFFESVQQRCAARVFGSWLLLVRGKVRRSGAGEGAAPMAVTLTATECWDIPALEEVRLDGGMPAVVAAMEAGDVLPEGGPPGERHAAGAGTSHAVFFANGFAMSRYAETGSPGAPLKHAPRSVWHA